MQIVIIGRDGSDPGAPARRQAARPAHIERARAARAEGLFITGGAILDPGGRMVGSVVMMEFPSLEDAEAWVRADPYVTGGVWQDLEIHPFRIAKV